MSSELTTQTGESSTLKTYEDKSTQTETLTLTEEKKEEEECNCLPQSSRLAGFCPISPSGVQQVEIPFGSASCLPETKEEKKELTPEEEYPPDFDDPENPAENPAEDEAPKVGERKLETIPEHPEDSEVSEPFESGDEGEFIEPTPLSSLVFSSDQMEEAAAQIEEEGLRDIQGGYEEEEEQQEEVPEAPIPEEESVKEK